MSHREKRPSWVIEQTLNWQLFDCCGDEDLFPFQCCECSEPLVLCYECDTLYSDLRNLTTRCRVDSEATCPRCSTVFSHDLMTSPCYRVSFDRWHTAGLDHLLIERPVYELAEMVVAAASQIEEWLSRGMRSTARRRLVEYRNLAESIAVHFPAANALRKEGIEFVQSSTLAESIDWQRGIPNPVLRAYALLGVAEAAVEQRRATANGQPEG